MLPAFGGCGDYGVSTTTSEPPAAPTATSAPTLTDDPSPEEVRQAVLSALATMGPVRVHAEVTSDDPFSPGTITGEQLIDREHHLARETRSADGRVYQRISIVGERVLTFTDDDEERSLAEATVDRTQEPWEFPLYDFYPLEYTGALSVTRVADGGWELVVRSPFLNQTIPADPAGGGEIRIEVGPDFLPRKMTIVVEIGFAGDETATDPAAPGFPERVTTETVYRIEHIAPLTESDVALSLPPGIEVTQRSVDLPLDHPRADISWPHYWLGREFQGVPVSGALFAVSNLDAAQPTEFISLSYGDWDAPPDEAGLPTAGLIDVQQGPHRAGEPDPFGDLLGMAGPFETQQRVVAGREATVLSRVTEAPSPIDGPSAFEVLVQFPDVTVYLQGGVDGGTVDALLAALQQL
ncbi:MAG: hypothetical protein ACYC5Q_07760 [Thermoleophilia bacterium]